MAPNARATACGSRIMGAQALTPYMPMFITVTVPTAPNSSPVGMAASPSSDGSSCATAALMSSEMDFTPLRPASRITGLYSASPLPTTKFTSTESYTRTEVSIQLALAEGTAFMAAAAAFTRRSLTAMPASSSPRLSVALSCLRVSRSESNATSTVR